MRRATLEVPARLMQPVLLSARGVAERFLVAQQQGYFAATGLES